MDNICIGMLAHVDSGKTTLAEAMLYKSKTIRTLGRVDNKNTFLDTNYQERDRGITIFSKQAIMTINNCTYTLLDTPGHVDFSAEMERTLQVLDYAILIISATDGIQSHTETLWRLLARYKIPTFIFVNKIDQPTANRSRVLEQLKNKLSTSIIDFSYPNSECCQEEIALCDEQLLDTFLNGETISDNSIKQLIKQRKLFPCFFGSALKITGIDEFINHITSYTESNLYSADFGAKIFKISRDTAKTRLTHLKVTGGTLSVKMQIGDNEKINQIRIYSGEKYTTVNKAMPGMICAVTGLEATSAGMSLGSDKTCITPMLEPVLTYKLNILDNTDVLAALPKLKLLEEEHPELHIVWNEFLREIQVQLMGTVQIEVLQNLIKERFNLSVSFEHGNIVYKETISNTVEGVGHFEPLRHYAEVHLILEPGEEGSGITYCADCQENLLDKNWQRLILTHISEKTHIGVLSGSPLTDVKITLVAGRAHQKHTEGGDFRQATCRAIRQGLMQADCVLLEPFYQFTLTIPTACVGRAMTDLERMKADFELSSQNAGNFELSSQNNDSNNINNHEFSTITGIVPVSEFGEYQIEVIAYTKGTGTVSCTMAGYKPCHNTDEVLERIGYDANKDTLNPSDSVFCSHGAGEIVLWNKVFEHMHLESVLAQRNGQTQNNTFLSNSKQTSRTVSNEPIGLDEIESILNQTYYANSSNSAKKKWKKASSVQKYNYSSSNSISSEDNGQHTSQAASAHKKKSHISKEHYLLVDGYNIIYAWDELKELASVNMDSARGRLLDILCNYQAMTKCTLIAVFDAYRVKGHDTELLDYNNIHVVYTKEAETADRFIEKFAHQHGQNHHVRVATSDGQEQIIIIGQGCQLVSAREFLQEITDMEQYIRETYLNKPL